MQEQFVFGINTVWVLLCAALVFFMEAGFAMLEAGFIRSKNSMNIIMKVLMDCTLGMLGFWAVGFALLYGKSFFGFMGVSGFAVSGDWSHLSIKVPIDAFFIFQAAFAVAAATIVSGAVAERMKFLPYMVFSVVLTAVIYPVAAHWVWNPGGWLAAMGMKDFAGSAAVHAVGGWASLAAVIVLGARMGKYNADGSINAIPGHNLPLAALGGFILWFGWFGFNPGSSLSGLDMNIARIAVTTNLAAAAGGTMGTLYTFWKYGKPDPSMAINGALAGLVAVTGGCAYYSHLSAIIIGSIAGVLVVIAVNVIDGLHFDDPVGAIAVHGVNGTFGALAIGLFAEKEGLFFGGGWHLLQVQTIGTLAVSVWAFVTTYILFKVLHATVGIRVSEEDEIEGMDVSEHGVPAYNEQGSMGTTGFSINDLTSNYAGLNEN